VESESEGRNRDSDRLRTRRDAGSRGWWLACRRWPLRPLAGSGGLLRRFETGHRSTIDGACRGPPSRPRSSLETIDILSPGGGQRSSRDAAGTNGMKKRIRPGERTPTPLILVQLPSGFQLPAAARPPLSPPVAPEAGSAC
jgi:hypothetical protein